MSNKKAPETRPRYWGRNHNQTLNRGFPTNNPPSLKRDIFAIKKMSDKNTLILWIERYEINPIMNQFQNSFTPPRRDIRTIHPMLWLNRQHIAFKEKVPFFRWYGVVAPDVRINGMLGKIRIPRHKQPEALNELEPTTRSPRDRRHRRVAQRFACHRLTHGAAKKKLLQIHPPPAIDVFETCPLANAFGSDDVIDLRCYDGDMF
jgi:hypothetical protein